MCGWAACIERRSLSRRILASALTVGALVLGSPADTHGGPARRVRQKVVVLGFDGMDPTLTQRTRPLLAVYRRDDVYRGEFLRFAPDLQTGFADGYRVGWQDTLGALRDAVIEDNDRKWSGDHCGSALEISGGVFFGNVRLRAAAPTIVDIAPTVFRLLGVTPPADLDGEPLI